MSKSKQIISLWIFVFFAFCVNPLLAEEGFKIQYTAQFSTGVLSFDKLKGYDVVGLKDGDEGLLAELGKPRLPTKGLKIALPAGMAVKNVYVVDTKSEEIPGTYNIFPSQPPLRTGSSEGDVDFVQPDKGTYASIQPYPSKLMEFVQQADLAGQGIAVIQVFPLQYVPAEKRLVLYTSITLAIEGAGGYQCGDYLPANISQKDRREYEQMVKDMVQNPQDVQLNTGLKMSTSMLPPGGPFGHVIITPTAYAPYFQPLVNWHNQRGLKDTVITTQWIYTNYPGHESLSVRNFIKDANQNWGTMYFLLGGENEYVPFVYRTYYAGEENTPSDEYYGDYDNDWIYEVYVGRVSVGSTSEITTIVNKILKYEKDPPRTNYPLNVLLIGMDLDASTVSEHLKDSIATFIPTKFNVTKVYDGHGGNHRDSTIYYLNRGQNLVNHSDHSNWNVMCTGNINHNWCVYIGDVDGLTNNDKTSIIVSTGCLPNYMDYPSDCISEHFIIYNPSQAGVAFTGNTRDGYFNSGDSYGWFLTSRLDKEWWRGLFKYNKYNLGQTLWYAKDHFAHWSGNCEKHCEWTLNLLGEPEMPIWTDQPAVFAVTIDPDTIPIGTFPCSVHVEDSTTFAPVESAYVCLSKGNEVHLTGYTNASGNLTLRPSPTTTGSMFVTVTKHNYIPSQQGVSIGGYMIGDCTGDFQVNSADIICLINYLFIGGPAPDPWQAGDANGDCTISSADAAYLINYLYIGGPRPQGGVCPK